MFSPIDWGVKNGISCISWSDFSRICCSSAPNLTSATITRPLYPTDIDRGPYFRSFKCITTLGLVSSALEFASQHGERRCLSTLLPPSYRQIVFIDFYLTERVISAYPAPTRPIIHVPILHPPPIIAQSSLRLHIYIKRIVPQIAHHLLLSLVRKMYHHRLGKQPEIAAISGVCTLISYDLFSCFQPYRNKANTLSAPPPQIPPWLAPSPLHSPSGIGFWIHHQWTQSPAAGRSNWSGMLFFLYFFSSALVRCALAHFLFLAQVSYVKLPSGWAIAYH